MEKAKSILGLFLTDNSLNKSSAALPFSVLSVNKTRVLYFFSKILTPVLGDKGEKMGCENLSRKVEIA